MEKTANTVKKVRTEIQGLRGIAVLSVLGFHIWPTFFSGGYIGVDVFFVLSGFLITSILIREIQTTGTLSFKRFYARRIRRLLPAASIVLITVGAFTPVAIQKYKWSATVKDIIFSALYSQNWRLAYNSIDYLASEETPGPLQHFWSLAIEEQFYIVWPLIILLVCLFRNKNNSKNGRLINVVWVSFSVVMLSLAASIYMTRVEPGLAYFYTHTRIFELGIGSLLSALSMKAPSRLLAIVSGWFGFVSICYCVVYFSSKTSFPGYTALIPTLGTAMIIYSGGVTRKFGVDQVLSIAPLRFIGDISYSLYLWHWPVLIYAFNLNTNKYKWLNGFTICAISIGIAYLSKKYVEDPFRYSNQLQIFGRSLPIPAPALASSLIALAIISTIPTIAMIQNGKINDPLDAYIHNEYPGALFLTDSIPFDDKKPFIPTLQNAREDLADAYKNKCHQRPRHIKPKACVIGDKTGDFTVALIGDSHAANWIPAFEEIGRIANWNVLSYTKSACSPTTAGILLRGKLYEECSVWSQNLFEELRTLNPDMIVLGRSRGVRLHGIEEKKDMKRSTTMALFQLFEVLTSISDIVVTIRDTPRIPFDPPECLSKANECIAEREVAMRGFDPLIAASEDVPGVHLLDMTDAICNETQCNSVVGNVLVWRDWHHLTATYSRTLAVPLYRKLQNIIQSSSPSS